MAAANPLLEDNEDVNIPNYDQEAEPQAPAPEPAPETSEAPTTPESPAPQEAVEGGEWQSKYENMRAALRDERSEKQNIMAELGALRERTTGLEQMREELDNYRKNRQQEVEQSAFDQDPATYLKSQLEQTNDRIESLVNQSQEANTQYIQEAQEVEAIRSHSLQYRQENPDYDNAFAYLRQARDSEYDILGVPASQREALFTQESIAFGKQMLAQGVNPAEGAYKLAQSRGYAPQAQGEAEAQATPNASPAQAEAAIRRLEQGQAAAESISGGAAPGDSVLKAVEEMSDAEFDEFWEKNIVPNSH